jgi:hypothetical protein
VAMRSLADLADSLATPSGFWKRELLGANQSRCVRCATLCARPEIVDE